MPPSTSTSTKKLGSVWCLAILFPSPSTHSVSSALAGFCLVLRQRTLARNWASSSWELDPSHAPQWRLLQTA